MLFSGGRFNSLCAVQHLPFDDLRAHDGMHTSQPASPKNYKEEVLFIDLFWTWICVIETLLLVTYIH